MSVSTGTCNSFLIFPRIRSPSPTPGPRYAPIDDRFALSYDALKMYGTPASAATFATRSAIICACAADSMTHGPAIKKSGAAPPSRNSPSVISCVVFMGCYDDSILAGGVGAQAFWPVRHSGMVTFHEVFVAAAVWGGRSVVAVRPTLAALPDTPARAVVTPPAQPSARDATSARDVRAPHR